MPKELLLVKLPEIENCDQSFFGVGYFSDNGFVFVLLTEDIFSKIPCRIVPHPVFPEESKIKIIGKIENLKPPKF